MKGGDNVVNSEIFYSFLEASCVFGAYSPELKGD